jgi:hypothetical protein
MRSSQKSRAGQAVTMTVVGMSIFLMAALGLAIDGSHLYVQRQLAQAAADAAAQAGMMSIFVGTYGSGTHQFSIGSGSPYSYTCTSSDAATPCYYAQSLNGFNTASDTVKYIANPTGITIPFLSTTYTVNLFQVTVKRDVPATLMKLVSSASTYPVSATATAAIVFVDSPVPIIVTHPTKSGAFNLGGSGSTNKIQICGGPSQSIQVNSSDVNAVSWTGNPVVDLHHAGPPDPGDCTTGTGASFGVTGGPPTNSIVSLGTTGFYLPGSPIIKDPLATVSAPADPTTTSPAGALNPATGTLPAGSHGCPAGSGGCDLWFPGKYTTKDVLVKNAYAVLAPGIYYMYGTNFTAGSNGNLYYATGLTDSNSTSTPSVTTCCGTGTGWGSAGNSPANSGILVYMTGSGSPATIGAISSSSNSTANLVGAPNNSSYKGMLFFVDRNAASATHSLDGGGGLTLTGTFYMTSSRNNTVYQTLHFQGNAGSSTILSGEIIASVLELQGTPGIVMNLNSQVTYKLDKVALVQ